MQENYSEIKYHNFNIEVAKELGITQAVILHHLHFWIEQNRNNGRNFHEGHFWTYNTPEAFNKQLPYLTPRQIRDALNKLAEAGYILKGNFNKSGFNRTAWYALASKYFDLAGGKKSEPLTLAKTEGQICGNTQMHLRNLVNAFTQKRKCTIGITDKEPTDQKADKETLQTNPTYPSESFSPSEPAESRDRPSPFFDSASFEPEDQIQPADLQYLNGFEVGETHAAYKRELGLFILSRHKSKQLKDLTPFALRQLLAKLGRFSSPQAAKEALLESVINGWAGVFEPKPKAAAGGKFSYNPHNEYDTGDNSAYYEHAMRQNGDGE